MLTVAVLGAGYMGSAITFPLSDNSNRVRLWGTWLDDDLLDASKKGCHPKLKRKLPEGVRFFYADALKEAVEGADVVIVAVTSEGFIPVFKRFLQACAEPCAVFALTKGFVQLDDRITRISEGALSLFTQRFANVDLRWVSIGGPVKAAELSDKVPTATMFGFSSRELIQLFSYFSTSYYRIFWSEDFHGVELSSAMKNVYAIVIGIADGLYRESPTEYCHNFKAFLFNQAIREMAFLIEKCGGKRETVFNLAGLGDLHATAASGRNGIFGRKIGEGGNPKDIYYEMQKSGEVAEGYNTLKLGRRYIEQFHGALFEKLPLFNAIHRIIFSGHNCLDELNGFIAQSGGNRL
jgi:glycerol-3-phosphate dehydrogenase (NAD(P)+)